jgi:LPXTG-motif cell wall-anchored protein
MKTKTFRKVMGAVLAFALVVTGLKFGEIRAVAGDPVEGDLTRVVEDYSVTTAKSTDKKVKVTKSVDFSGENNVVINFDIEADESLVGNEQSKGDVVLVIDASGTLNKGDSYKYEKAGAKQIAKMVIENGFSVGVVSFESTADIMCNPSKDYDTVAAAIDKITCTADSPHFTNMQAGLHVADVMLGEKRTSGGTIILLSDGKVNQCYRPYGKIVDEETGKAKKYVVYNLKVSGESYTYDLGKTNMVEFVSDFKYNELANSNASLNHLPSTYIQSTCIRNSDEKSFPFQAIEINQPETSKKKKIYVCTVDNQMYRMDEESVDVWTNPGNFNEKIYCKKCDNSYATYGDSIEVTKWYWLNGLPNRMYYSAVDTGYMTYCDAERIKEKGTTIYTITYPNMNNPIKKKDYDGRTASYEKYVMTNVATTKIVDGKAIHYNQFVELGENISWDGVVKGIKSVLPADDDQPTSDDFSVDLTDEFPSYLTPAASTDGAYKVEGKVVTAKVSDFNEDGHATLRIVATLDKEAMIAAYRANTSIGKVSADASKIWIDMNKAASVAYGTETINVPNPKLPFGIWNVNVEYQVEVPDSTGFSTEYKVVTAPAVQLFETETYTIKNVDGYDVTNQAKFKEPFVITTYSKGVDVVSPSDNKVKNSIGSEVNFDGESRNVNVFVGYELKSYSVSFYNENGEGIIEKLIPSVEPVIPVADAPVDPQPAEGQQEEGQPEEGQQDGEPQENGERVIHTPIGEITRDPEITSEPAIVTPDPQVAADEQPTAPVEGANGEDDEEEGFPEIPSSFTSVYEVYTVQVKYGVRISDGSMAEANALANVRAGKLNDERHTNVQFAGWTHADKTSAGAALIAPITGDLSVYASYTSEAIYYVTYKQYTDKPFNGVSNYGTPVPVVSGGSHTVLTTGPALSGYEFKGWSLSDAEDATVLDVTVLENITSDVVLYPVYEKLPDPEPVNPDPVNPDPVDPDPVDPNPVDPNPTNPDPTPSDPAPSNPTPSNPTPSNPNPSNPNPNPSNPDPAKEPEIEMGPDGTPLGDANTKGPQIINYDGEDEISEMDLTPDEQALGDAVLPKTGTTPVPVFYVAGGLLVALAGILFFVKKRH